MKVHITPPLYPVFALSVALDVIIIDQLVKWLTLNGTIPATHDHFADISIVHNTGIAFGIQIHFLVWIVLAAVLVYLMVGYFIQNQLYKHLPSMLVAGLIVGGGLSNLGDKVFRGYVVDMFDFHFWPVFNVADTCIVVGVGLLLLCSNRANTLTS